jgi:integrase/recombinase XerD
MGRTVPVQAVSGPLARYAPGFAAELTARGYSPWAVTRRLWLLDHLSRWLAREQLGSGGLTPPMVEEFLRARSAAGYVTWISPHSMVLPLDYLREIGVVPVAPPTAVAGPLEELLGAYRRYLVCERGLAESTIAAYEHSARLFLVADFRNSPGSISETPQADEPPTGRTSLAA